MSYTTKVLWIDKETFTETEKASWTQDLLLKGIERPYTTNPQYLLILKDNEFMIVDKQGNLVLRKPVDYTIQWGHINDDGKVAIITDYDLYVYDKNGNLLYNTTFANLLGKWIRIAKKYLWLCVGTSPPSIYVYNLSDFSYSSFSINARTHGVIRFQLDEDGENALGVYDDSNIYIHFFRANTEGIEIEKSTSINRTSWNLRGRPDLVGFVVVLARSSGGTLYNNVVFVNGSLDHVVAFSYSTSNTSNRVYVVGDLNLEKGLIYMKVSPTVRKWTFDWNTMTYTEVDTFNLEENPEDAGVTNDGGDMTPDGKYAVLTTSDILVIDWETKQIVKTIPKAFSGAPVRILTT